MAFPLTRFFLISERLLTPPTPSSSSSFGVLASQGLYGVGSETICLIVSTWFSWMAFHHLSYLSGWEYLKVAYLAPFSSWSFIPMHISFSDLFLFADDSKLQHTVSDESDIHHMQQDIDSLVSWSKSNSLYLNSRKCAAVRFSLSSTGEPSYSIENVPISVSQSHRDLGVLSDNYSHICSRAYCNSSLILFHGSHFCQEEALLVSRSL